MTLIFAIGAEPVHPQQIGANKSPDAGNAYTISVHSQLVVETVTVNDKSGKPIGGLTAKDFTLTEDGVPQKIRYVEHQSLRLTVAALPASKSSEEEITLFKHLTRTSFADEKTGKGQYKDHRLLALYFDMTALRPEDQFRALAAAQKFVRTQMTPVDLVSVLRYQGGSVDILQDFTSDRNRLLSILQTLVVGEGQGETDSTADASSADTGAAFGQDDSEFNVFNTDRQLSALQTAANLLGQLNEKKALIYFAGGLRLQGVDNQAQLHATVNSAIRAGVSFWPVDSRGLVAEAPLGSATQGSPGNSGMYSGQAALANQQDFQQSQDVMFALAGDTGGKALLDNNDLTRGVVQAQQSFSDYYIVTYLPSNAALNGAYRKVKVSVNDNTSAHLDYRQGYYAGKQFEKFTAADKERQLEDALMLGDPMTELTVAMEINYFQLNRAEYFVPLMVKIPGSELVLAKKGGAEHTLIDFVGEIKNAVGGATVSNVRDNIDIKLTDHTSAELSKRPIEYNAGFTLLPGRYVIKLLVRDNETGHIGTYQASFTVPNLNKEVQHVPISSVVLSGQRVDAKDTLYDAMKGKEQAKEMAANPLIVDGKKIVPSVTRVFTAGREMYVYLQAYEPESTAPRPLLAYLSLYRDSIKVFESKPTQAIPVAGSRLGMVPLNLTIDISHLPPGDYNCQMTILDPTAGKATYWQAPIKLVP